MNSIYTSLFNTMSTFFFSETRWIACKCLWKLFLWCNCINKFTNHWMFTCTYKVKVFAFNLVHHCIHFIKAHNACNNITSYHIWRNTICETSVNHKISCIRNYCWMKSCNIAHKIIETITCNLSSRIKVNTIKLLHNLCMIRYFKIWNYWFTELFNLYIFTVIFTYWYWWINNVRNCHHNLSNFFIKFCFFCF